VLITIAIIGVIASLTLPALMSNVQRQQAGPALLRAIATLDTANAIMFTEQDMYSFSDSCRDYVNDCFRRFISQRIGADNGGQRQVYQEFNDTIGAEPLAGERTGGYTTKNGFIYYFGNTNADGSVNVQIDINGLRGPNMVGKDLFYATISGTDDGKVFAWGSRVQPTSDVVNPTWENSNCDANGVTDARTCAGSIIDHGGNVVYRW
jgi:type II secretory pathway pseudopilin PulG